jgi:hypothetical protein
MFTSNLFLRSGALAVLISALSYLTGCTAAPPTETLTQADDAIKTADRAGAAEYAPQLLSSARTKLKNANQDTDADEARTTAEEAFAEAVLANAKTAAAKQAKETDDMQKAINALEVEISRDSEKQ